MNKRSFIIFLCTLFIATALAAAWWIGSTTKKNLPPIIQSIEHYRKEYGTGGNLNLTPVIKTYLKLGTSAEEAKNLLVQNGFKFNKSRESTWDDKNKYDEVYIAHYYTDVGPNFFHLFRDYKLVLYFKHNKLVDFSGQVTHEHP